MARLATILLLLMLGTSIAFAQDSTGREAYIDVIQLGSSEPMFGPANLITVNPLKFIWMYNLNYYHRFSNLVVAGGGLQMPAFAALRGWGAQLEVRLHPGRRALSGFYLAPNVSYNRLSVKSSDVTATALSIGILGGWQLLPSEEFAIGVGIGYDRYFLTVDDDASTDAFASFDGGLPALRFDIGYAF